MAPLLEVLFALRSISKHGSVAQTTGNETNVEHTNHWKTTVGRYVLILTATSWLSLLGLQGVQKPQRHRHGGSVHARITRWQIRRIPKSESNVQYPLSL